MTKIRCGAGGLIAILALMISDAVSPFQDVKLDFSQDSLLAMNLSLAIIMFGVAISININDFREVIKNPKGVFAGVTSQFLLFPFVTFLLILAIKPAPGLALGLLLVSTCPGGNISNFFTLQSGGNVALSVSLTVFATFLSPFMTPFNFSFWGGQTEYLQPIIKSISLDYFALAETVVIIMVIPLIIGIWTAHKFPATVLKIGRPIRVISILILSAFIVVALTKNWAFFKDYYHYIIYLVFIHNALALITGLLYGKLITGSIRDSKTISIETGIQNAGLGLIIVITFFGGEGGMALIVAWWGIWNIIAGLIVAQIYKKWGGASTSTLV